MKPASRALGRRQCRTYQTSTFEETSTLEELTEAGSSSVEIVPRRARRKAHGRLVDSSLGVRVIKKKKEKLRRLVPDRTASLGEAS